MDWKAKKQLIIFFVVFLFFLSSILGLVLFLRNPTCFDHRQNQGEEGIDCGGPCKPCVKEVKDLVVLWAKPLKLEDGRYDAAALIKNPNISAGIPELKYRFKLFDKYNILIGARDGKTFVNPADEFAVLEANIDTGERIPKRAVIEFPEGFHWEVIKKEGPQLSVSDKKYEEGPPPRLSVRIYNKSIFDVEDISASAVLYDNRGRVLGVSSTHIDKIEGNSFKDASFLWPAPFGAEVASSQVFVRIDLTKGENYND